MEPHSRSVEFYVAANGQSPFEQWLQGLKDVGARARIIKRLDRLVVGNFGDWKVLEEGVCELRLDFGPGYRVYFGQDGRSLVILLCGGAKGAQKGDIERAKRYWRDYLGRGQ